MRVLTYNKNLIRQIDVWFPSVLRKLTAWIILSDSKSFGGSLSFDYGIHICIQFWHWSLCAGFCEIDITEDPRIQRVLEHESQLEPSKYRNVILQSKTNPNTWIQVVFSDWENDSKFVQQGLYILNQGEPFNFGGRLWRWPTEIECHRHEVECEDTVVVTKEGTETPRPYIVVEFKHFYKFLRF